MSRQPLPELPGCGRAASVRLEVYSPREGRLHGSLDASVYACDRHGIEFVSAIQAAGLTAYRVAGTVAGPKRCGDGTDFTDVAGVRALHAPAVDEQHPAWCARGAECAPGRPAEHRSHTYTVAADPDHAGGVPFAYRVTLAQVDEQPPLVEVESGLPDAFEDTARWLGLSLAQSRQLAVILAELAGQDRKDS